MELDADLVGTHALEASVAQILTSGYVEKFYCSSWQKLCACSVCAHPTVLQQTHGALWQRLHTGQYTECSWGDILTGHQHLVSPQSVQCGLFISGRWLCPSCRFGSFFCFSGSVKVFVWLCICWLLYCLYFFVIWADHVWLFFVFFLLYFCW